MPKNIITITNGIFFQMPRVVCKASVNKTHRLKSWLTVETRKLLPLGSL